MAALDLDELIPGRATLYPEVDALLKGLLAEMQCVLGEWLVGLYLYGSVVMGDFDLGISDVDLLAVTEAELEGEDERLERIAAPSEEVSVGLRVEVGACGG